MRFCEEDITTRPHRPDCATSLGPGFRFKAWLAQRPEVPPPPLSFPTPCRSPGGGGGGVGDRHLVNPKFFVAAHCVVVWVTVL